MISVTSSLCEQCAPDTTVAMHTVIRLLLLVGAAFGCSEPVELGTSTTCAAAPPPCHRTQQASGAEVCSFKPIEDGASCSSTKGVCTGGACVWSGERLKWALVPGGQFEMGCFEATKNTCSGNGIPQHRVEITSSFWMGVTEVTAAQYLSCVKNGPCVAPKAMTEGADYGVPEGTNWGVVARLQHPMNGITWAQALAYCGWVGGTLPTEAQWELAARGRCTENGDGQSCGAKMRTYPWGDTEPICNVHGVFLDHEAGCGGKTTQPVATASLAGRGPYGHYDLLGNVAEYLLDYWGGEIYDEASTLLRDPVNKTPLDGRSVRGGAFANPAEILSSSHRTFFELDGQHVAVGFRCVRSTD